MAKEDYIIPEKNILPEKEFIGLTDDEINEILNREEYDEIVDLIHLSRAIEQALKEKNHVN
jgi:hypothetical protein